MYRSGQLARLAVLTNAEAPWSATDQGAFVKPGGHPAAAHAPTDVVAPMACSSIGREAIRVVPERSGLSESIRLTMTALSGLARSTVALAGKLAP